MWLLVRAAKSNDGVLVSSPETTQGREAWQWTVSQDGDGHVVVDTDPSRVEGAVAPVGTDPLVTREPGSIVVLVPTRGEWEVASSGGPWSRTLAPGDVFLAEDDRAEELRLTPTASSADPALSVVTLRPVTGRPHLRWIP